jgi:hypothetical protein
MRLVTFPFALAALVVLGAAQSPPRPLSKSDLVRLLTGGTLAKAEITAIIRRNCTTFTPSERDRGDLRAVGADDAMLAVIAECRRAADALFVRGPAGEVVGEAGGEAQVRVEVRRGNGAPATRLDLALAGSGRIPGGGARDAQATTDDRGVAVFEVQLGRELGSYTLTVATASGEPLNGRTAVTLTARPAGPFRADIRPRRVDLEAGAERTLTVALRDALGNTVAAQRVDLVAPGNAVPPQSRQTDARGEASFALSAAAFRADTRLLVRAGGRVVDSVEVALPAPIAPAHTGFVSGQGQRGRVGGRLGQALVFEVRDSANAGLANRPVVVTGVNAVVEPDRDRTDADGRVAIRVRLGERAGPAAVVARVGAVERRATLVALPGPATVLRLSCGGELQGRLVIPADTTSVVLVAAVDAFGNAVALSGIQAAVGDRDLVSVGAIASDSAVARVTLRGRRPGSTNLAVTAAGLRTGVVTVVQAGAPARCSGPR